MSVMGERIRRGDAANSGSNNGNLHLILKFCLSAAIKFALCLRAARDLLAQQCAAQSLWPRAKELAAIVSMLKSLAVLAGLPFELRFFAS
jgi:hypothetical protein